MKKYKVYVHYDGCISYDIVAEDEDEAIKKAEWYFGNEPAKALADNFCDSEVDVQELKEGKE